VHLAADSAKDAVAKLGKPLGLSPVETAAGIFAIANAHMGGLVTRRVVSRGFDPRDFVIFAYGGAGGMHGAFYAAEAAISEVVVPSLAGTFSALGVATAPLLHTRLKHDFGPIPGDSDQLISNFVELEKEVQAMLERDGVDEADRTISYSMEMRFGVQVHTVQLPVSVETWRSADFARIADDFDALYDKLYGKGSGFADAGRFVTSFMVEGYGRLPIPDRAPAEGQTREAESALVGTRSAYFDGSFVDTAIYRYDEIIVGDQIEGPAIIEARETTIVIPPASAARVDEFLNVRITTSKANGE